MADEEENKVIYENEPSRFPMEWSTSPEFLKNLHIVNAMNQTKHGLVANVPIICRGKSCPYAEACWALPQGLAITNERCPVEANDAMQKFAMYAAELEETNNVNLGLVKELVDIEVQLERADKRLAIDGDFIMETPLFATRQGDVVTSGALHPAAEFQDRLRKRKGEILSWLHLTPKDKAGDSLTLKLDPSTYTAQLLAKKKELEEQDAIEADYKEVEE